MGIHQHDHINKCLTLSHYHTVTTQLSRVLLNIKIKSPNKHLVSIQPRLMPFSLCTGLTHPTTLSFGTLQILLPALANLANVLSFLFLFICDSSPNSNLLQMKSLQTSFLNPNFPWYQDSLVISEFPSSGLASSRS